MNILHCLKKLWLTRTQCSKFLLRNQFFFSSGIFPSFFSQCSLASSHLSPIMYQLPTGKNGQRQTCFPKTHLFKRSVTRQHNSLRTKCYLPYSTYLQSPNSECPTCRSGGRKSSTLGKTRRFKKYKNKREKKTMLSNTDPYFWLRTSVMNEYWWLTI